MGGTDGMSEGDRNEKCGEVWGPGSAARMEGKGSADALHRERLRKM